jgi:hypothetical protein
VSRALADAGRLGAEACIAIAAVVTVVAVLRSLLGARLAGATLADGLRLTLEFLLAGGLLRLASHPTLRALGITATVIAVRQVIGLGLRYARTALTVPSANPRS